MSLQRQFNRQEYFAQGEEWPSKLDAINEQLSERGFILHPTKGIRKIREKRGRAQMILAEQRRGIIPPTIISLNMIRLFITTGRWK